MCPTVPHSKYVGAGTCQGSCSWGIIVSDEQGTLYGPEPCICHQSSTCLTDVLHCASQMVTLASIDDTSLVDKAVLIFGGH